ncbi:MAG: hypothetical protein MUO53_18065, partial [Maribacter sp.]|nr:hypothetical protein [Maribacter sp.]
DFPPPPPAPKAPDTPNPVQKIINGQEINAVQEPPRYSINVAPSTPNVVRGQESFIPPPPLPMYSQDQEPNMPPPPPEPTSPLVYVIEMAKKGAIFYYEGKEITSDKAIDVLKKNKKINIDTRGSNGNRPVVRLSSEHIEIDN